MMTALIVKPRAGSEGIQLDPKKTPRRAKSPLRKKEWRLQRRFSAVLIQGRSICGSKKGGIARDTMRRATPVGHQKWSPNLSKPPCRSCGRNFQETRCYNQQRAKRRTIRHNMSSNQMAAKRAKASQGRRARASKHGRRMCKNRSVDHAVSTPKRRAAAISSAPKGAP